MSEIKAKLIGLSSRQDSWDFLEKLREIEGIKVYEDIQKMEFKEVIVSFGLIFTGIAIDITINLISDQISKLFQDKKSIDNKPIEIIINNIYISQGDSKQDIRDKLSFAINK